MGELQNAIGDQARAAHESLAKIGEVVGDVIARAPIPASVIQVEDRSGDPWGRTREGLWTVFPNDGSREVWEQDAGSYARYSDVRLLEDHGPLKVTAVREPEQVDVLDLVRQYGHGGHESGVAAAQRDEEADDHHDGKARRLYDRIEAEVQRLRAAADATGFLAAVNKLTIERDEARDQRDLARKSRDEHHNRLEAIKGELVNAGYASPDAEPIWIGNAVHLLVEVAESLQAAEAQRHDSGAPIVLSLSEVPEGAVALIGAESRTRYPRIKVEGIQMPCWQDPDDGRLFDLGALLDRERSVTVEMAPPRTPLDDVQDLRDELTRLHNGGYAGAAGPAFALVNRIENTLRELGGDADRSLHPTKSTEGAA
ncbi:hypothetical protein ABT297_04245 [Dactylosporangium sp. NPDC000555]|uniref:hypothetical protein n=1 Tax=Dactylosporangium sp. NPDC000555 TaxID=3154260 RepID=UPI0033332C9C